MELKKDPIGMKKLSEHRHHYFYTKEDAKLIEIIFVMISASYQYSNNS